MDKLRYQLLSLPVSLTTLIGYNGGDKKRVTDYRRSGHAEKGRRIGRVGGGGGGASSGPSPPPMGGG